MHLDLDTMSRGELLTLRRDVDRALETLAEREKRRALQAAQEAVAIYGFDLSDIAGLAGPVRRKMRGGTKNPPRFRNPENPEQTWSGRGRKPQWLKDAEAQGHTVSEFAI